MNAKEKKRDERTEICKEAIEYLNEQADRGYHWDSKGTLKLFTAEWSHRFGIIQYRGVIDYLVLKWKKDTHMAQYLRPATLFGPEKFPEYLDEARSLIKQERQKKRKLPFKYYIPVNKASSKQLIPFDQYDPTS